MGGWEVQEAGSVQTISRTRDQPGLHPEPGAAWRLARVLFPFFV
jgi:hypothetical protein